MRPPGITSAVSAKALPSQPRWPAGCRASRTLLRLARRSRALPKAVAHLPHVVDAAEATVRPVARPTNTPTLYPTRLHRGDCRPRGLHLLCVPLLHAQRNKRGRIPKPHRPVERSSNKACKTRPSGSEGSGVVKISRVVAPQALAERCRRRSTPAVERSVPPTR